MANILNKESALFERDENGGLVPQLVKLEADKNSLYYNDINGVEIMITPMTRGEIKRVFSSLDGSKDVEKDVDDDIIVEHCKNPEFSKEEVKMLKPDFASAIVASILKQSGLDVNKGKRAALNDAEDDFAKN